MKQHAVPKETKTPIEICLCVVCGERPGKAIYGWKCLYCHETQRTEREDSQ